MKIKLKAVRSTALMTLGVGMASAILPMITGTAVAAAAPLSKFGYQAAAYSTQLSVGSLITSGPTALANLGCTSTAGINTVNSTAAVNAGIVKTAAVSNTASSSISNSNPTATATSTTAAANIGNGLITADTISTSASVSYNTAGSAYNAPSGQTVIANLKVAGVTVAVHSAPNSSLAIAGVGTLIINHQVPSASKNEMTVDALTLQVNQTNTLGLAIGATLVVGHSRALLVGPTPGLLIGQAYGTSAPSVAGIVNSGPTAFVGVHCEGGVVDSNPTTNVNLGILTIGTVTSEAKGTVGTTSTVNTTNSIQNLSLLPQAIGPALITADAITTTANGTDNGTTNSFTTDGSVFVNLKVANLLTVNGTVPVNSPPINLVGLGTLYLNKVEVVGNSASPTAIRHKMIELDLSVALDGYPAGSQIIVGYASAGFM